MFKTVREDIAAVRRRDPAARSTLDVVLSYPGIHAVLFHRLANPLWRGGWHATARWLSHVARIFTGIEIHPGATIGRRLFIDHGMGVVIGETAEIGDDVTLYQGVTLGGTSLDPGKRHPTLQDDVIVGAGAKVLGPLTLHRGARVGSNAVVVKDVAEGTTVVGIPARPVKRQEPCENMPFTAYGTPCVDLPDPVARVVEGMMGEMDRLAARVAELEAERAQPAVTSNKVLEPGE